ncbi:uncharacterized protein LOC116619898 [Nematostella vectensis]|uniref:uncharacterized protein LOC116619898 n=1 Tax=Nematostella vectensis TaxID=45351 RepID=UPI0013904285|nr:uncharacterized protein LOC116619898 [Nematostella vectensis]XP_032241110.1 uncharacterized protein LOC116619898 [Nematostella vectensis]
MKTHVLIVPLCIVLALLLLESHAHFGIYRPTASPRNKAPIRTNTEALIDAKAKQMAKNFIRRMQRKLHLIHVNITLRYFLQRGIPIKATASPKTVRVITDNKPVATMIPRARGYNGHRA